MSDDALVCTYVRTPFHFARKGALAEVRPDTLVAHVIAALVERAGIDPATLEDVIAGCAIPRARRATTSLAWRRCWRGCRRKSAA